MSTAGALRIGQAAGLWRDALVLLTSRCLEALGGVLRPDAEPMWIELHAICQKNDEHGDPVDLAGPLDLTTLGERSGSVGDAIGVAMRIGGGLSRHEAAEVVSDAITCMALAQGYLDPRIGINAVRGELACLPRRFHSSDSGVPGTAAARRFLAPAVSRPDDSIGGEGLVRRDLPVAEPGVAAGGHGSS